MMHLDIPLLFFVKNANKRFTYSFHRISFFSLSLKKPNIKKVHKTVMILHCIIDSRVELIYVLLSFKHSPLTFQFKSVMCRFLLPNHFVNVRLKRCHNFILIISKEIFLDEILDVESCKFHKFTANYAAIYMKNAFFCRVNIFP
jgi:hypothetical protein